MLSGPQGLFSWGLPEQLLSPQPALPPLRGLLERSSHSGLCSYGKPSLNPGPLSASCSWYSAPRGDDGAACGVGLRPPSLSLNLLRPTCRPWCPGRGPGPSQLPEPPTGVEASWDVVRVPVPSTPDQSGYGRELAARGCGAMETGGSWGRRTPRPLWDRV